MASKSTKVVFTLDRITKNGKQRFSSLATDAKTGVPQPVGGTIYLPPDTVPNAKLSETRITINVPVELG